MAWAALASCSISEASVVGWPDASMVDAPAVSLVDALALLSLVVLALPLPLAALACDLRLRRAMGSASMQSSGMPRLTLCGRGGREGRQQQLVALRRTATLLTTSGKASLPRRAYATSCKACTPFALSSSSRAGVRDHLWRSVVARPGGI